ncbi:MAG: hypothetical protein PVH65_07235 [Chloroflexota bacterium]
MTARKIAMLFTTMLFIIVLAGCNGGSDEEPTIAPTEESQPVVPTATPEAPAGETPTSESTAYPAPPTATPPGAEGGYPASTPQPTYDPYPGGLVTIIHPMGLQCEEAIFPDLSAAISSLEEAGIAVVAAEEIGLEVCEACGCATSEHFRVQINVEDLDRALEMGWQR